MKHFYRWPCLTVMTLALLLVAQTAGAAPKVDLWPRWEKNDPANKPVLTGMGGRNRPGISGRIGAESAATTELTR